MRTAPDLALGFPIPDGPVLAQIALPLGVVFIGLGFWAARRPYRTGRPRGGFGSATGRVVEHREGKRPTVVQFVPEGRTDPVIFKTGDLIAVGTDLPVLYSLADPRNARLDRPDGSDVAARGLALRAGITFGLVLIALAVIFSRAGPVPRLAGNLSPRGRVPRASSSIGRAADF